MLSTLNGETRVYFILGDPIAQVKSPAGFTRIFAERGRNAALLPIHVRTADFEAFMDGAKRALNVDGIIFTVPHKFAGYRHATEASERAHFLGAVNAIRRVGPGRWEGDMFDGAGFAAALRQGGCDARGRRALLIGAGGAGSAIALALVEAGVAKLAIHDTDDARRQSLLGRLAGHGTAELAVGSPDPTGFDLVVNATPIGMAAEDPLPVLAERLTPETFVADVITAPVVSPLLAAARARGCGTQTGTAMFLAQTGIIADFLLAATALA